MTLDDDVRECCDDIESVNTDAGRVRKAAAEDVKKHCAKVDSQLERFQRDAAEARKKLEAGIRDGLDGLVSAWREGRNRLRAHLRLIEARSVLASAQRLAKDQYYVAAESELTSALRLVREACTLLGTEKPPASELVEKIEHAIADIKREAQAAGEQLESVVATNERLLANLEQ